jgi:hypothetical protein
MIPNWPLSNYKQCLISTLQSGKAINLDDYCCLDPFPPINSCCSLKLMKGHQGPFYYADGYIPA